MRQNVAEHCDTTITQICASELENLPPSPGTAALETHGVISLRNHSSTMNA